MFDVGKLKGELNSNINYIPGFKKTFRGNVTLSKIFTPKQLCSAIIKDKYDLAVSYLEGPCSRILSAYSGKKIAWVHIESENKADAVHVFRNYAEACDCYNSYDKIVCVAKTVEDNFNNYFNLCGKTQVVYNVVDSNKVKSLSTAPQSIVKKSDDCYNIVSVGRLVNQKGFERLVKIHKKLLDDGIKNRLYIVGGGEKKDALNALTEQLGVKQSVTLTGFLDNPYNVVANCDLFVCSSYKEGFSTACTEAVILGVPVISTDVSGANELINNGCGFVCKNDDNALYDAVKNTLVNKNIFSAYADKAKQRATQISLDNAIAQNEKMFDQILG